MMLKIFFLTFFQAYLLFAASPEGSNEPESNPASPVFPKSATLEQERAYIESTLRECMEMPRETETEAMLWLNRINEIAYRFSAQITLIKNSGDKRVLRQGNPQSICIISFDTAEFRIEFSN